MNFTALTDELVNRGAEGDTTRNGQWINLAYRRIINAFSWPFTEAEVTGSAGAGTATVADFRKALVVSDKTTTPGRPLHKITLPELVEDMKVEDVALTGTPQFWYYDGINSIIKTYPLGGTIYVRYNKRVPVLSGANSPIFLDEYHLLIVDRAMVEVYKDNDELATAAQAMQDYRLGLAEMASDYEVDSREGSYIQVGEPYDG